MFKNHAFHVKMVRTNASGNDEVVEVVDEIKGHFQRNKMWYALGGGIIIGVGGGLLLHRSPTQIAPVINNSVEPVFNNTVAPVITIENIVNNGGYARKIIRCIETDQMWPSMTKAAEATGNHIVMMSKHCNGHVDNLQGLHYVIDSVTAG